MIKKKILFLAVSLGLVVFSLNFSQPLKSSVLEFSETVKMGYIETGAKWQNAAQEHFSQAATIKILKEENEELKRSYLQTIALASELEKISLALKTEPKIPGFIRVRCYSYINLGDYTKAWIDFENYKKDKIYGLVQGDKTAGIAMEYNGKLAGFLNGDPRCVFAVYTGEDKIPGVIFGNKKDMLIKYIPPWLEPKIGEKVYTSGLDGIFFEGLSVGKVTKVIKGDEYNSAVVEPDAKASPPSYFYLIS